MKRCPECRRDYYDDTLLYCLDDGNALLEGPASMDEPATAILHSTAAPGEAPTRAQIQMTDQTAILLRGTGDIVPKSRGFDKRLLLAPLALAVMVLGGFFGYRYFRPSSSESINSIAVLPFQNVGGSADSEYLSDGLAESLIYRLSQLPNLKVSPASSVVRYKGKEFDAQKIAAELGVQAVMSGRMIQRGENLSISVELIDVANNRTIWGEQYDRKMADLLATQSEMAKVITDKLQLKLTGNESGISKKFTDNNEAYQSYLQGRFYWNKRTEADLNRSVAFFDHAIAADPNFALAYSGLADAYLVMPNYAAVPKGDDTYPKARENAEKALQIDPSLAAPHATIASVLLENDWKFAEAEAEYKRAIELDPKYASARQWYGEYLIDMRRFDEGLDQMRQAQQLEPLSVVINTGMGWAYFVQHRWDDAIAESLKALELDPAFKLANDRIIDAYLFKGEFEKAIEQRRKGQLRQGQPPDEVESAANQIKQAFQAGGPKAYYQKRIELAEQRAAITGRKINSVDQAGLQIRMGNKEAALDFLDKALTNGERHIGFLQLKAHPVWDPLRGESRFQELLRKIGLPE